MAPNLESKTAGKKAALKGPGAGQVEMVNSPGKISIMMMIGFKVLYSPEVTARKKMYLV